MERKTKHNKAIEFIGPQSMLFKRGLFGQAFPIEKSDDSYKKISLLDQADTVEMTESFKAPFENTGIMIDGTVWTTKTIPVYEKPVTLGEIREMRYNLSKYILTGEKKEKFKYLRGAKKIPRKKPNGETYFYSEGSMSPFDSLDLPEELC